MSNILTNDGNPSGVVLNDGEYGMVVVTATAMGVIDDTNLNLIGNFRIVDDAGYEYRTNSAGRTTIVSMMVPPFGFPTVSTANFNTEGGTNQSDSYSIVLSNTGRITRSNC